MRGMSSRHHTGSRLKLAVLAFASIGLIATGAGAAQAATSSPQAQSARAQCGLADSALSKASVKAGTNAVRCGLVGTVITNNGIGVTVPAPGMAAGADRIQTDGSSGDFQIEVAKDGSISFPAGENTDAPAANPAADTAACSDGAYSLNDLKATTAYKWWMGDGTMPAGLSRSSAKAQFADAINNITGSYNSCGYSDLVSATSSYQGYTTAESNMTSTGACGTTDTRSTWDAGNLATGTVAQTCWWAYVVDGAPNRLAYADVRYNETDYNFTANPTSGCSNKYDIRSVGTHEAGHVFGVGHVGSGHNQLTMYTNSFTCTAMARTLGKGDVAALRARY